MSLLSQTGANANHTLNHEDLTYIPYDAARAQIRLAGDVIQSLTGLRPVALAYPYGTYDASAEDAARAEGIQLAFVTDHGYGETWARRLDLHRTRVAGMVRLPDGSFGGGETADGLLRTIAADAGRTDFNGPGLTPWPWVTATAPNGSAEDAAGSNGAGGAVIRSGKAPGSSATMTSAVTPAVAIVLAVGILAAAAAMLLRRRWRPAAR